MICMTLDVETILQASRPMILRHTVAIVEELRGQFAIGGSGVLFQVGDAQFLFTAAHVLKDAPDAPHINRLIGGMGGDAIPLEAEAHVTDVASNDVAVVEVPSKVASELLARGKSFLRSSHLELRDDDPFEQEAFFAVCGFPEKDARTSYGESTSMDVTIYVHGADAAPHQPPPIRAFDPKRHLALVYERGMVNPKTDYVVKHPRGMSGGGIWRIGYPLRDGDRWTTDNVRLMAIQHTYWEETRSVVGTRVDVCHHVVQKHYPALRPLLALSMRGTPGTYP
jgi:hypothetical protein